MPSPDIMFDARLSDVSLPLQFAMIFLTEFMP